MADAGDVARMRRIIARLKSVGVQVREIPGWESRGATYTVVPFKGIDHHDASSRKSGEWGALGVIVSGRPGISGPLSQFQVARCLDGVPKIAVVAAGRANHAGKGGPMQGIPRDSANSRTYGNEKANDGVSEPYTAASLYATTALHWACAIECGQIPGQWPWGHKEWAPTRKTDPKYNMPAWRARVAAFKPANNTASGEDDLPVEQNKFNELMENYAKSRIAAGASAFMAMPWNQKYGRTRNSMHGVVGEIWENASQLPALRAEVKGLVGAIAALAKGEKLDEARLLASIEEASRKGTEQGIIDAARALQALEDGTNS